MLDAWQDTEVATLRGLFTKQRRRICYQLATGAGKTVIAGDICQKLRQANRTALFLVHRRELVGQVIRTLEMAGLAHDVGVVHPDFPQTPWAPIQIGSVFSWRRLERLKLNPHMVIIDEAHHVRAKTWERILSWYVGAYQLLLTATPKRLDGMGMYTHADYLHCGPGISELIQYRRLCPTKTVYLPVGFKRSGVRQLAGDLSRKELSEQAKNVVIIANTWRNFEKYVLGRYHRIIFFGVSIEHSKTTALMLREHGVRAEHVDGDTPSGQRSAIMGRFSAGVTEVLCNVDLISEGLDVPQCDCIIDAQPTDSLTRYLQKVGRSKRFLPGKIALHVDLVGNIVHGHPDDARTWTLEGSVSTKAQKKATAAALRCCGECATVYPARRSSCPSCLTAHPGRPILEVDVDLKEALGPDVGGRPNRASLMESLKRAKHSPDPLATLQGIQESMGYPKGWAEQMLGLYRTGIAGR